MPSASVHNAIIDALRGNYSRNDYPDDKQRSRYFRLLEDVPSGNVLVWAIRANAANTEISGTPKQVLSWGVNGIIAGAKAGYHAKYDRTDGAWSFVQGDCIVPCEPEGSISVGTPPAGTVGAAYSHTVTATSTNGDLAITGLPAGLTATGGSISGTPTTPGTYWAIATATSANVDPLLDDCTITKVVLIVINPAS